MVAAMEDANLQIEVVSGTSAGAVNAAGLAAGFSADRLAALWTSLSDADVYRQRRDIWNLGRPSALLGGGSLSERLLRSVGWTWLWDWRPLRRTLTDIFAGERIPVIGAVPLAVSSVQVTTGELIRFASSTPPRARDDLVVTDLTVDHLIASAAIPLLFRPARLGSTAYWDGGIVANTPLAPALSWEPDAVVVVTTTTLERPAPEPSSLAQSITLLIDTVQRFTLEADLARAAEVNRRSRAEGGASDRREVDVLLIDPRGENLGDGLRFDPDQARRLFELGRRIGAEALHGWRTEGRLV